VIRCDYEQKRLVISTAIKQELIMRRDVDDLLSFVNGFQSPMTRAVASQQAAAVTACDNIDH
jgi:hypothetical protein